MENNTLSFDEKAVMIGVMLGSISSMICWIILIYTCIQRFYYLPNIETLSTETSMEPPNVFIDLEKNEIIITDEINKYIDCSVCLDTDESDIITLSICGHKFHKNCINTLVSCPNCRKCINVTFLS